MTGFLTPETKLAAGGYLPCLRSKAGFSTVEVLIALIVFDVGLLGAVTTTALTGRLLVEARNRARATLAASERIELVRHAAVVPGSCAALSGGQQATGCRARRAMDAHRYGWHPPPSSHHHQPNPSGYPGGHDPDGDFVRVKAGFTLIESMVALLLTVLVLALVYRLLVAQQRTASLQAQRVLLQTNLRSAAAFISAELRDVSTDSANLDLLAFAPESVTYRATRGSGIACRVSPTSVELLGDSYGAFRRPQSGRDSLLVYVAAGPGREWVSGPVTAVGASTCGGASSLRLSTLLDSVTLAAASTGPLFPVRLFEIMQIKLYQSQGNYWLGARSVSAGEVIQPVLGPLDTNGTLVHVPGFGGWALLRGHSRFDRARW